MEAALQVTDLTKTYPGFQLDHVSFTLPQGAVMGLIGENGAGKSTTIKAILDLIGKDDGTVTFWGQKLSDSKQLKEDIGVVFDQGSFYETLTPTQIGNISAAAYTQWDQKVYEGYLARFQLPKDKPRYLMGVGTPLDIAHGINAGIDMFDCVLPTRNARNGTLYTSLGKVNIKRKEYAEDDSPLDPACNCYTCRTFSRAYLRHLYVSKELLAFRLNSLHNLTYFLNVVRQARQAILEDRYASFLAHMESLYPDEAAQGRGL